MRNGNVLITSLSRHLTIEDIHSIAKNCPDMEQLDFVGCGSAADSSARKAKETLEVSQMSLKSNTVVSDTTIDFF